MSIQLSEREITVYLSLWEGEHQTLQSVANDTGLPLLAVSRAVQALERCGAVTCERVDRRIVASSIKPMEPAELIHKLPCGRLLPYID